MTICSLEMKLLFTIYNKLSDEIKLFIILFKLAQLLKLDLSLN